MKRGRVQKLCIAALGSVLSGVFLLWCPDAFALNPALDVSQYAHTAWKVRDGFTKGYINSIAQTPDGYLWLGTEFGLLRFDGVKAIPWQPPATQHLPSDDIAGLLAARDGTLWIATRKGLATWKDGKLTLYPEFAGQMVVRLLEDREGTIWVGTVSIPPPGKLCEIRKGRVHCDGEDGSLGPGVLGLYEDGKGNLWAGVLNGLWRWKPGPPQFYSVPGETNGVQGIAEDHDGALLISTRTGIRRIVGEKTETYPISGRQFGAQRLLRDHDGGLWIGSWSQGLIHVHQGKIDAFQQSDGLSGVGVTALFEDREGNVWVATFDGLDRFREFAVATLGMNQGLSNAQVASVLADRDGSIWVGTLGGLNIWRNVKVTTFGKSGGKLNGLDPYSLYQDSRGRIWVSTFREFGYLEDDRFVPVSGVPGGEVDSITEDSGGNLWIANLQRGLIRLSPEKEIQEIPWDNLGRFGNATALAADPVQGGLWLGFVRGGVEYYRDGKVRATYTASDGLAEGYVADLRLDGDGTLWAATLGTRGGLSRLKSGHIATLNRKNGLPCDEVYWSIEDDYHSLWMFMGCALVRIAKPELDAWNAATDRDKNAKVSIGATVLDTFDGVRAYRGTGGAPRVAKVDGRLWYLGVDGVNVVDPGHLPKNKLMPPVHVEQVTADRKTYEITPRASETLPLPALTRDLQIDYTALSLAVPEKVLFKYKLEGFDNDWQDAGNRRQAFYTNLPPKNYTFRVKACNNSGVWNEEGTALDFSVAPAYYQTLWFRLTLVAAFLAALWVLYQLRLQQLAREFNAGLEARVNERTRIARELHDSLLQGFQGLMFRLQAVRDLLPGRASEAMQALDIALERGDKAIAEGRDTVSDLREPILGDSDIAQALTALGNELALQNGNGLVPCVRVLVEGAQRELNPMARDEIYRIAREALRNAFRHARAQKIEAEITYGDSEFLLHVRDDGDGIDPDVANQGARAGHWGLPGMRERAKSFGGKLEVWSEHGAGTEIELSVPAAIAYGKFDGRRRFWSWRKKNEETNGKQP